MHHFDLHGIDAEQLCLGRCQQIQRTCGCPKNAQLSHSFVLTMHPAADHTDPPYAMWISKPTAISRFFVSQARHTLLQPSFAIARTE